MSTSKEKKKYISKSKFLIHLQAEQQQKSINSHTEQNETKKKYKFLNWKLDVATLNINGMKW